MSALLAVRQLSLTIGDTIVCEELNLDIQAGQCWALLGRNGVGKTTLVHQLAGLRDSVGHIHLAGSDIAGLAPRARARHVAVLLQHSSRGFGGSVLETVLSGRHPHLGRLEWEGVDDLRIVEDCIAATGLESLRTRSLDTLSGGELRRVEIARLLAQQADVTLLDEPLNHLDLTHQAAMLRLLAERCVDNRRALLMVVHDLNVAYHACDQWLLLHGDGEWRAGRRETLADARRLSNAFGHPIERLETSTGPWFRPCL